MSKFTQKDTIVAVENCLETTLDGETVLLHRDAGTYYGLQGSGTRIWELVQEPVKVAKIQETIFTEYDVSREACERDVLSYIHELAANDLITRIDEADS